ncbi:hypothetical protein [Streptomyces sp. NPDC007088]|uniref:effector-associated constant component EACC1 n=1 Tax=Streptomyces sp. NPDC007088 TaxID=3364773 RepID=UPI0036749183
MRIVVSVHGGGPGAGHELRRWMAGEPDLRGRVRVAEVAPRRPGAMGSTTDAFLAVLEPGGVAAVFAAAVVAWVQSRRGGQTITVTRPDGMEITVTSTQVKGLDARQVAELVERLAAAVDGAPAAPGRSAEPGQSGEESRPGGTGAPPPAA